MGHDSLHWQHLHSMQSCTLPGSGLSQGEKAFSHLLLSLTL